MQKKHTTLKIHDCHAGNPCASILIQGLRKGIQRLAMIESPRSNQEERVQRPGSFTQAYKYKTSLTHNGSSR
ncbi:hypothetical protein Tco_0030469, partial [Tanacetum coccineum]